MYHVYTEPERELYPVCTLVTQLRATEIRSAYLQTHIHPDDVLVMDLHQSKDKKKTPVSEMKEFIELELEPELTRLGVTHVLCTDGEYFKVLTGCAKTEANLGYVLPSLFGSFHVAYVPNYSTIFYAPAKVRAKIEQGVKALSDHRN